MVINTQFLIKLLQNIDEASYQEVEILKALVTKYPYFQVIYTLLAKLLQKNKSVSQEKSLNIASLYAPKRQILKDIMENNNQILSNDFTDNKHLIFTDESIDSEITNINDINNINNLIRDEDAINIPLESSVDNLVKKASSIHNIEKQIFKFGNNNHTPISPEDALLGQERVLHHKLICNRRKDLNNETFTPSASPTFIEEHNDKIYPDTIISDSLAKIMVSQEKFGLAIKIYERLILKNPKKEKLYTKEIYKINKQKMILQEN